MSAPRQRTLFTRKQLAAPERPRRGRPKKPGAGLPHVKRAPVDERHPHHVTVRMRRGVWNLRSQRCFRPITDALRAVKDREGFRVVHFSVQGNHMHLVTEADDRVSMSNGMRALLIRIAKRLNSLMGSSGRLYGDRFHERVLHTPNATRNVVRYVLGNHGHHYGGVGVDAFSSANPALAGDDTPAAAPESWLLRIGWRRAAAAASRAKPPAT